MSGTLWRKACARKRQREGERERKKETSLSVLKNGAIKVGRRPVQQKNTGLCYRAGKHAPSAPLQGQRPRHTWRWSRACYRSLMGSRVHVCTVSSDMLDWRWHHSGGANVNSGRVLVSLLLALSHRSPTFPSEWLTLAAKSPRGFLTFIGCRSQRTRL